MVFATSAVLIFRLTGHDPHAPATTTFMVVSTITGVVATAIGGYVAVLIARKNIAATALAIIIAAFAFLSAAFMKDLGSMWSNIAAVVLMAPAARLGGVRVRRTT